MTEATPTALDRTWLILLMAVPLLFDPFGWLRDSYRLPKLILLLGGTGALCLLVWGRGRGGRTLGGLGPGWGLLIGAGLLSLSGAVSLWDGVHALLLDGAAVGTLWLTLLLLPGREGRRRAARALTVAGIGVATLGTLQALLIFRAPGGGRLDPISSLGHRNFAAQVLLVCLPFALALVFSRGRTGWRVVAGVGALLMSFHLAATGCRGAWIGLLAQAALLGTLALLRWGRGIRDHRRLLHRGGAILAGLLLVAMGLAAAGRMEAVTGRARSLLDSGGGTGRFRVLVWRSTLAMALDHPIRGVGAGNFRQLYPEYRDPEEADFSGEHVFVHRAHQDHLQTWAERGLLGLLGWLFLLATLARLGGRALAGAPEGRPLVTAAAAAVLGTLVHACFSTNLRNPASLLLLWCAAGLLVGAAGPVRSASPCARGALQWSLVALGLVGLLALAVPPVAANRLARQAARLEKRDDPAGALEAYRRAMSWWSLDHDLAYHAGHAAWRAGRLEEAELWTRRSLELFPRYRNARFNLGVVLESTGRLEPAAREYRSALALDPRSVGAANNLVVVLQKLERPGKALEVVQEALRWNPWDADLIVNHGVLLYEQGQYQKAARHFRAALDLRHRLVLDSSTVNHLRSMGWIEFQAEPLDRRDRVLKAQDRWGRLRLDSGGQDSPEVDQRDAGATIQLDRERGELTLRLEPHPEAVSYRVRYRMQRLEGQVEVPAAGRVYAKAAANLGAALDQMDRSAEALGSYREAVRLDPDYPLGWRKLGTALVKAREDPSEAAACLRRFADLAPEDPATPGLVRAAEALEQGRELRVTGAEP